MKRLFAAFCALALLPVLAFGQVVAGVKSVQVPNNTTPTAVCLQTCTLNGVLVFNNSATIAYLKLYATPQASVTVGTTVPTDRIMIPANTSGAGAVIPIPGGPVSYPGALTMAVTTGIADNDTTAPAAGAYLVSLYTK